MVCRASLHGKQTIACLALLLLVSEAGQLYLIPSSLPLYFYALHAIVMALEGVCTALDRAQLHEADCWQWFLFFFFALRLRCFSTQHERKV